ncbi:helix-turn-helix transcriptional regulator [Schnuerera sp.]|uniref:helix-turn-helix domain-containing protein n=1 Tax=Schnuerera sp. TaxID=2794844 RepID=UPI002C6A9A75|nr:helix-turn-helix transcriptional regulator [Schnuerera sp.]HSH36500.1 helix-turn-helix transcriptional regulator [Schnuerera sp.]
MTNKENLNFKEIGSRIRLEREKLNLTREKFAEIVELSTFYIGQIERGDRKMSVDTLVKIANTLHISVDYLLYGSNIYTEKLEKNKYFSVFETIDENYNQTPDDNLQELLSILVRCSEKEIALIKDITKLILPYLVK